MENELLCTHASRLSCHWGNRWIWLLEKLRCVLKGIYQSFTEPGFFLFVPGRGFFQFSGSFPADIYVQNQPLMRALARARTSSTSSSSAFPDSISLIRRQISISQASATSCSAGPSRLATKSLANFARSLSERVMAASLRASSSTVRILCSARVGNKEMMQKDIPHNKGSHSDANAYAPPSLRHWRRCCQRYVSKGDI
jgi:hypothetical protein